MKRSSFINALVAVIICSLILMRVTPRIPQPQKYHDFADKRQFFGIPNAVNVVSNFPFIVIGLTGLVLCYHGNYLKISLPGELLGWTTFYIAVAGVGFGSGYYHLKPNHTRLICDRLPMTIAFTTLMAILAIERIDEKKGTISLIAFLLVGVICNVYWRVFNDIRPYTLAQFVPCIAVPAMAIMLPPLYTHSTYWLLASGFYPLAMVGEVGDKVIYKLTLNTVSGHTLKHLLAAIVPVILTLMLANRTVDTERQSLVKTWRTSLSRGKQGKLQD